MMKHLLNGKNRFIRDLVMTLLMALVSERILAQEVCPNSEAKQKYTNTMQIIMPNDDFPNKMRALSETQKEYARARKQYDACAIENSNLLTNIVNLGIACNSLANRVNQLADEQTFIKSDLEFRMNSLASFKESVRRTWPKCGSLF